MYLFLLSKENIELSKSELIAALRLKKYSLEGHMLWTNEKIDIKELDRLAYTKSCYKILFMTNEKNIEQDIDKFNWQRIYKSNYCVRFHYKKDTVSTLEKKYGSMIWHKLKNPKINLTKPKTKIVFIKSKEIFCCTPLWRNTERFELRNPNYLPEFKPIVLKTRLARAVVNLTGAKKKETILDPMCGIGGLLIEAGKIGCKIKGYDIDPIAIYKCRKNLEHNKIKKFFLRRKDSTLLDEKIDYVVLDFPYGKNTKKQDLEILYTRFLKALKKILKKRAVILFPSFIGYKKIIKRSKFKIVQEHTVYVHKSLSRKIMVLE